MLTRKLRRRSGLDVGGAIDWSEEVGGVEVGGVEVGGALSTLSSSVPVGGEIEVPWKSQK